MIGVLLLVIYCIGTLFAARRFFYVSQCDEMMHTDDDEKLMRGLQAFLCFWAGLCWPLAVPVAIVLWSPKKTPQELEAALEERDAHIKELERELGYR